MNILLHKIVHIFGLHSGRVYSELRNGSVYMGFQCSKCGKIEDLHNVDEMIDRELNES